MQSHRPIRDECIWVACQSSRLHGSLARPRLPRISFRGLKVNRKRVVQCRTFRAVEFSSNIQIGLNDRSNFQDQSASSIIENFIVQVVGICGAWKHTSISVNLSDRVFVCVGFFLFILAM